jgi:hypothetical protein
MLNNCLNGKNIEGAASGPPGQPRCAPSGAAARAAPSAMIGSSWQMGSWPRDKRMNAVAATIIIACWGLLIIHTLGRKKDLSAIKEHAP